LFVFLLHYATINWQALYRLGGPDVADKKSSLAICAFYKCKRGWCTEHKLQKRLFGLQ